MFFCSKYVITSLDRAPSRKLRGREVRLALKGTLVMVEVWKGQEAKMFKREGLSRLGEDRTGTGIICDFETLHGPGHAP